MCDRYLGMKREAYLVGEVGYSVEEDGVYPRVTG